MNGCSYDGCSGPGEYVALVDGQPYCAEHYEEVGRYDPAINPAAFPCGRCGKPGSLLRATTYGELLVRCADHQPCETCLRFPAYPVPRREGMVWLCYRHGGGRK